jgi:hypothetical protein
MNNEPNAAQSTSDNLPGGKPKSFVMATGLVALYALLNFAYFKPLHGSNLQFAGAIASSVLMVFYFWRQNIGAKRVVLITAVFTIHVSIRKFPTLPAMGQTIMCIRVALAAFLLYYLNTRSVRNYFRPTRAENAMSNSTKSEGAGVKPGIRN